MVLCLGCQSDCAHGAAMERACESDEASWDVCGGVLGIGTGLDACPFACKLYRPFVGFGARVAEEHLVRERRLHQALRELNLHTLDSGACLEVSDAAVVCSVWLNL